ncbi:hypothetical protein HO133_004732 [Letharia lupina]|uniref:Uncharacterized protein n=1 Tax=Letharia lupina TaxID=560253 RepID=A0A8H6FKW0_9LECA|nr:uncharacterized protein HO133_004732 [Letharia lupina]KAF6230390.1 hypothetical protein HO133_004732 [Letharia lupina]
MIYSEAYFVKEPTPLENLILVETTDGRILEVTAVGNALLKTLIENDDGEDEECMLTLANVHYVEGLSINLLSLGTFQRNSLTYIGKGNRLRVYDDNNDTVLEGELIDTLCKLRLTLFKATIAKEIAMAALYTYEK